MEKNDEYMKQKTKMVNLAQTSRKRQKAYNKCYNLLEFPSF